MEWLYAYVLGIKLSIDKDICISPSFSKELAFAKGEYKAKNGKIFVEWKYLDEKYYLTVTAENGVKFN